MLVLTTPVVQPIREQLGVDLIMFGVLAVIALEMGLYRHPMVETSLPKALRLMSPCRPFSAGSGRFGLQCLSQSF